MRMRRILVLEDEATVALHEEQILRDMTGADIVLCSTCAQAHEHAMSGAIDLAIIDVVLPDGRGFALADVLQEHATPYIFVTATSRWDIPLRHRAAPILTKPFHESELRAALARLIVPASRRGRDTRLQAGR